MYEEQLQKRILEELYKIYRASGRVLCTVSNIAASIPEVSQERVYQSCEYLNKMKLISAVLLTSGDGYINEITVRGRMEVESTLLTKKEDRKNPITMNIEKKYQFFISSTYKDLIPARQAVMASIVAKGHIPVGMEYFPAGNENQFDYIKRQIDQVDYYILITAGKYGTVCPETGLSYTEMEFDYALSKNVPVAVLVYKDLDQLKGEFLEKGDSYQLLLNFREKVLKGRMAAFWEDNNDLKYKASEAIDNLIKTCPRVGWVRADKAIPNNEVNHDQEVLSTKITLHEVIPDELDLILGEGVDNPITPKVESVTIEDVLKKFGFQLQSQVNKWNLKEMFKKEYGNITEEDVENIIVALSKAGYIEFHTIANDAYGAESFYVLSPKGFKTYSTIK